MTVSRTRTRSPRVFRGLIPRNTSGSTLLYSTFLGGSRNDTGFAIAVNSAGQAYVMGQTTSSDFPVTVTAFQEVFGGGGCGDSLTEPCPDTFIAKLNATGTALSYSSYLGGFSSEFINTGSTASGSTIAIDTSGRAYVTGTTTSANFPVTNTAFKRTAEQDVGLKFWLKQNAHHNPGRNSGTSRHRTRIHARIRRLARV